MREVLDIVRNQAKLKYKKGWQQEDYLEDLSNIVRALKNLIESRTITQGERFIVVDEIQDHLTVLHYAQHFAKQHAMTVKYDIDRIPFERKVEFEIKDADGKVTINRQKFDSKWVTIYFEIDVAEEETKQEVKTEIKG